MRLRRRHFRSVEVLRLEPGDAIIYQCDRNLSTATAKRLKAQLDAAFPGVPTYVVQDGQIKVMRMAALRAVDDLTLTEVLDAS